jgi:cytochrome c-type biogenesis protein CcmF
VTAAALLVAFRAELGLYPLVTWSLGAFVVGTVVQEYWRAVRARMRGGDGPFEALATLLRKNQRRYGGYVVHLGVVFILVGIAGAAFNEERLETLKPGGHIEMNGYSLRYLTAEPIPQQHYGGAVARVALYHEGKPLAVMAPEKRMYWLEQQPASIPSIRSTLREDLYVLLTAIEADGSATLKVHRNPLVNWIWIGGFTFVLGTVAILWPHGPARPGRDAE